MNWNLSLQVVHFSKLVSRKSNLEKLIPKVLNANWVTEGVATNSDFSFTSTKEPFGVSKRLIGMDLGVNSRSLSRSRRKAQFEGWGLLLASYFDRRQESLVAGNLFDSPPVKRSIKENLLQHIECLEQIAASKKDFGLVLEDDAIPLNSTFEEMNSFLANNAPKTRFALFCGSGAGLTRTISDRDAMPYGIYETRGYYTRTAVATIYSRDVAVNLVNLFKSSPLPDWMPIDYLVQVGLRKLKCKSFWQDPPWFIQGSESGEYQSSLR